ncbi:MAG: hypothetical protein GF411_18430 [Candidatus Lokiarchaeota archaeon]|nr:hypothetical protein [Candidatus Lokiarchaeota archaeon]
MLSKLIRSLEEGLQSGEFKPHKFFDRLIEYSSSDRIAFCKWVVDKISFEDHSTVVKLAFTHLALLRHLPSYETFLSFESRWTNTYHNQYQFLKALFENGKNGADCNCAVYHNGRFNTPPYQEDLEIIEEKHLDDVDFGITHLVYVRCIGCGKKWEVGLDYIYHYPHSHWSPLRET